VDISNVGKTINNPPIWGWFVPPIKMVIRGIFYGIVLPTLMKHHVTNPPHSISSETEHPHWRFKIGFTTLCKVDRSV
jgi:hypothetical protein